jgi:nitrate reductase gamma subunit
MNPSEWIIGRTLPYLALVVGCGGLLLRVGCWLRTPVPFHLTLFPLPDRGTHRLAVLGRELFLQTNLRHFSPVLWLWVWLFHLSLVAILAGHVLGLSFPENPFRLFGFSASFGRQLSPVLGTGAGALMILALTSLLIRRILVATVRRYCRLRSYFELILLLSIAVTGMLLRLNHSDQLLQATSRHLAGLFCGPPAPLPGNPIFLAHFLLVLALLCYLPFSRLVHLVGFFLQWLLLRKPPVCGSSRSAADRCPTYAATEATPDRGTSSGFSRTPR